MSQVNTYKATCITRTHGGYEFISIAGVTISPSQAVLAFMNANGGKHPPEKVKVGKLFCFTEKDAVATLDLANSRLMTELQGSATKVVRIIKGQEVEFLCFTFIYDETPVIDKFTGKQAKDDKTGELRFFRNVLRVAAATAEEKSAAIIREQAKGEAQRAERQAQEQALLASLIVPRVQVQKTETKAVVQETTEEAPF